MLWTGQWMSEWVSEWVRNVCISHQSDWIYYKPIKFLVFVVGTCNMILLLVSNGNLKLLFFSCKYTNREITTTWYYVNSRKHVDSEKIRVPDGIWTHDLPWSSRMLYHWATGDSVVSKSQIVGIDWNRITRLHSHVLGWYEPTLTASRCHIKASHMNSLTASRHHIKAYWDASNQPPKWVY